MLEAIKQPVDEELKKFEPFFRKNMGSNIRFLDLITNYIYRNKGKQLRPIIVFLSAGLNGKICQSTYVAAGMIELLQTATLIHDDVVDESFERRGAFSINALWRSKVAVLVGDFLLSKGLLVAVQNKEYELLEVMSNAVREMSEGELLQIEHSRKMDINEEAYYDIIRKKTAYLIASCCENGAISAGADSDSIRRMHEFGINLGMAFQIRDDLFDYQPKGLVGKPNGNDIKEKKLTLPLIYALREAPAAEGRKVLREIRSRSKSSVTISTVVKFTNEYGGISYATGQMLNFKQQAQEVLNSFPDSDYRQSLMLLTDYVTDRNK